MRDSGRPADPDIDQENPAGSFVWRSGDGRARGFIGVPFFPRGEMLIDPQGAVWSTEYGDAAYRIRRFEPGGDTLLLLEAQRAAVPVSEAARDSALDRIRELLLPRVGDVELDASRIPVTQPAISGMLVAAEGDLWVRTPITDGDVFDVYDREGRHQRTVRNPLRLYEPIRPYVRQDQLWAVVVDDLDVQYVVRARIVAPPALR